MRPTAVWSAVGPFTHFLVAVTLSGSTPPEVLVISTVPVGQGSKSHFPVGCIVTCTVSRWITLRIRLYNGVFAEVETGDFFASGANSRWFRLFVRSRDCNWKSYRAGCESPIVPAVSGLAGVFRDGQSCCHHRQFYSIGDVLLFSKLYFPSFQL